MRDFLPKLFELTAKISAPNLIRIFLFLVLLLSIPLTVLSVKTARDIRSLAAGTLTLRLGSTCTSTNRQLFVDYTHPVDGAPWYFQPQIGSSAPGGKYYISSNPSGTLEFAPPKFVTFYGRLFRFDDISNIDVLQVEKSIYVSDCGPPPDTTAPTPPGNLRVTNKTTNSVSLAWDASTDSGGSGLAGYRVYRDGAQVATTTSTSYSDSSLTPSTTYSYYVKAYDNANNSANSSTISTTTLANPPPPKPTVSISASPASITSGQSSTLSWSCTPNDGSVSVGITASSPPNIGTVACSGSKTVTPGSSITYTAVASGPGGTSDSKSTSITVNGQPPPPPPAAKPPSTKPSGPSSSTASGATLESLQLELSVPYLVGKLKVKVEIASGSKELEISPANKSYSLDLKSLALPLNKEYSLALTSKKTLIRKVRFTPTVAATTVNPGDLLLGDLNQDNRIDSADRLALIDSIADQTLLGDLNADKDTNSLDWAITLTNLGKRGD
ncbi:MAG: hypothetical protein A2113_02560 [Candidatus Woykebacteria bacterium GWA1_44_8]|uniref:Fibronectin type-III domain-containing protein n=1 Tax=Candidatus Woykebacteria bacterium GWA1_44_8 TaxID=1802591 RepID=A0A1G1W310_9BACT|nr:MAG: hypothetical protein A2113_02560 [Candidatus Woykebacteria bacterium GWA1_44_8]